jgi:hypothetical protein
MERGIEGRTRKCSLAIPCARATRGLRRPSLDARTLGNPQAGPPMLGGRDRRRLSNGGFNKALMPAQVTSLSSYKYRGRETDWDRMGMAVRDREKARHRHNAPTDGRVKREVYQHSAYAPVAQWIEHQTTDLGVGGSSPSGRTKKQQLTSKRESQNRKSRARVGGRCPAEFPWS